MNRENKPVINFLDITFLLKLSVPIGSWDIRGWGWFLKI